MKKQKIRRLGDLQLQILKALWERGEATVSQVHESVSSSSDLAYTTVATMLRKMEARSLVGHRQEGRSFIYRARVDEAEVSRNLADHFVDRVFEGSLTEAVSHLLRTRDVSVEELAKLEQLIKERKNRG